MKKLVALFLSALLILTPCVAFAQESVNVPCSPIVGYLADDEGNIIEVPGFIVESASVNSSSGDASVTYGFNVPLSSGSTGSGEYTESSPDSAYESHVYLTIYYKTRNNNSEYLLTSVSGYWEIEHPYNTSVTSASVRYGCSDLVTTQSQLRSVGNNFSFNTGFSTYITKAAGVMGANLTLKYLMGTSRKWTFTLTNNLFNEGITY